MLAIDVFRMFDGFAPPNTVRIEDVMQLLPRRCPLLLVDKIVEIEPAVRITGVKLVTRNEQFLARGKDGDVRLPDLLNVQVLAQTGAVLLMRDRGAAQTSAPSFRADRRGSLAPAPRSGMPA